MAQTKGRNPVENAMAEITRPFPEVFSKPMRTVVDMNGTFLEGLARIQREWAEFVQRRTQEDVAVARQLVNCRSFVDMYQIYGRYLQTTFQQYREQSAKVIQSSDTVAQRLAETAEEQAKEAAQ
jgi:hypothetical protein